MDKTTIIIIMVAAAIIIYYTSRKQIEVEYFDVVPEKTITHISPYDKIPPYNAYVPFESPPDPRYVYVQDVNAYLLPYVYLDLSLPFDQWMYLYFPSYYSQYYPEDYTPDKWPRHTYPLSEYDYMNNYFTNTVYDQPQRIPQATFHRVNHQKPYVVTKDYSKIVGAINTIKVDTDKYPTRESGFGGGWNSMLFTDNMAYASGLTSGRGLMGGLGSKVDGNRNRFVNYTDKTAPPAYVGSGRKSVNAYVIEGFGQVNDSPIPPPTKITGTDIHIPPDANTPHMPHPSPVIPCSDDLYQMSFQYFTDSRANAQTTKPDPISAANPYNSLLNDEYQYAHVQTRADPAPPPVRPYYDLANNLFIQYQPYQNVNPGFQSFMCTNQYLSSRCGNSKPDNPEDMARFDYVNKYNFDGTRPAGSNRLGRGLGTVTGLEEREIDYSK